MAFVEGDTTRVVDAIRRAVARRTRAVIVIGIVPDPGRGEFEARLREAHAAAGATEDSLILGRAGDLDHLHRLNRTRDVLLRTARLILLTAGDESSLRALQAATVDLTTTPDIMFELRDVAPSTPIDDVIAALRTHARQQTALVDLSGLLPSDVGATRLRVEDIYMDLISGEAPAGDKAEGGDSAQKAAPSPRRLLVVGPPGAGKTTFLRMLAAEQSQTPPIDRLSIGPRTAVFVPLPAFARALDERRATLSLHRFIGDWLEQQGFLGASHLIETRPAELLLLLDGLDEVRSTAARRAVVEEVRRSPAEPCVVMTTRTIVLDELTADQLADFRVLSVKAPNSDQVSEFLQRFFEARHLARPDAEARQAAAHIQGDAELRELSRTPLILVFLALLHELEGRIPDRRSLLYGKVADILLDRWERARARARGTGVGARSLALGDTRRLIGALAWWMLDGGRDEVSATELRVELARIERDRGATADQAEARAEALAEVLQSGSAVLTASTGGGWRFVHATLAEYFAGVEMARGGARWEQVLEDVYRTDWQEIVTFCAGELGVRADDTRLERMGQALLARHTGGRYAARQATLLGAVLREDPGFAQPTLRALVERFDHLTFEPKYWPRSRPAVAEAFAEVAAVAAQRTWGPLLTERLLTRVRRAAWATHQLDVLRRLPRALVQLGADPALAYDSLIASPDPDIVLIGWRERYQFTPPADREAVVALALRALPRLKRWAITQDFIDLVGPLLRALNRPPPDTASPTGT